jgi:hypothetical protein
VWRMAAPCCGVSRHALKGTWVSTMAEPDASTPDLLARAERAQAHSRTLRRQVAEAAEAVAQVEEDVARVHEGIAEQGGSLAAQAREHAKRAREVAARSMLRQSACAWSGRLRTVGLSEPTRRHCPTVRTRSHRGWPAVCRTLDGIRSR